MILPFNQKKKKYCVCGMPITQTIKKTCCPCVLCLSSEITHAAVKTNIYILVGREENSKLCSKVGCLFYIHTLLSWKKITIPGGRWIMYVYYVTKTFTKMIIFTIRLVINTSLWARALDMHMSTCSEASIDYYLRHCKVD